MLASVIIACLITFLVIILSAAAYLVSLVIEESDDARGNPMFGIDMQNCTTSPVVSPGELGSNRSLRDLSINLDELKSLGLVCNCVSPVEHTGRAKASGQTSAKATSKQAEGLVPSDTSLCSPSKGLPPAVSTDQQQAVAAKTSTMQTSASSNDVMAENQLIRDAAMLAAAAAVPPRPEDIHSAELNSRLLKVCESQLVTPESELKSSAASHEHQAQASVGLSSWHSSASFQKNLIHHQLGSAISKQIFDDLDAREMQLGGTALHWCKSRKSLDRLVKLGLPLEIVNRRQETALHVAVRRHKLQVLIGLLNYEADVESQNEHGETPLIVACKTNDIFAAQLLLIFDADPDATDDMGLSARHHTATICARHSVPATGNTKNQTAPTPSAAHLILAMLNVVGAKRCASRIKTQDDPQEATNICDPSNIAHPSVVNSDKAAKSSLPLSSSSSSRTACADGCSPAGTYNGNSYNRWPNYKRESLYKRHMFSDLIKERVQTVRKLEGQCNCQLESERANSPRRSRLLCIDGGGLRGVIVCQIMIEFERHLKRPMYSYFDWVGGTSVGAFIAGSLSRGTPLRELRRVCFNVKDEVFSGGRPYNSKFLERVLKRTLGSTTRLSDLSIPRYLAFTSVLADRDPCQLKIFRNYKSPSQVLEAHGFASDFFNSNSGQAMATNRQIRMTDGRLYNSSPGSNSSGRSIAQKDETRSKKPVTTHEDTSSSKPAQPNQLLDGLSIETPQKGNIQSDQRSSSRSDIKADTSKPVTANNSDPEVPLDEDEQDPLLWQVVRASAAAPFFFKPYGPFLDGGIISNNPTLDMLNEFVSHQKVREFLHTHGRGHQLEASNMDLETAKLDLVVSLGTGRGRVIGRQAMADFGQIASGFTAVFSPVELVRSIRAARDLFKRLMQQSCHTDDHILDRAQAWCSSLDIPYFRINPPLAAIFSIDDKRDEQLINALWQTKLYMRAMRDQMVELATLLDDPTYRGASPRGLQ